MLRFRANSIKGIFAKIVTYARDPLYKNSFFIMLTSISSAGFGFLFWMLAAKLYPKEDVGVATAMVSSAMLLVGLSRLGLDFSIIRFFPERDKSRVFSTSVIITTLLAVTLGIIFVVGTEIWSPELALLRNPENLVVYLVYIVASSVVTLTGISFVASRKAEFNFLQSLILGSRVLLLFPLVFLGVMGIFGAVGISFVLALFVALFFMFHLGINLGLKIDRKFLNDAIHFSAGNYLTALLITAPNQILPIMVLNVLGAGDAAHYYIAFAIATLIFMIPGSISTSLFVEGSHGEELKKSTIKSLIAIFLILTPAVLILYLFGGAILSLIGKDYATSGFELLKILLIASFFVAISRVFFSIKRIQKDVKNLVLLSGLIFILLLSQSYIFMIEFGIKGIGYAWISSYGIASVIVGVVVKKERWV
ncbi:MAG: oligosaccharide flippase family protein [Archaeoglobus sp.]|nr:oligosaccharide flippase family protein [Archaeoglobus sp.]